MKEKVLVTGAGGYIGRHVVSRLIELGYPVIANDFSLDGIDERAEFNKTRIFGKENHLHEQLGKPERIIHLAWRDGFIHNSDAHMEDLSNHYNFLKKMMENGVTSISVMGSMHEVGYWEGEINEDTPCNPMSMYGIAKNALRQSFLMLGKQYNISTKWLRGFYIYGDDLKGSSIFAKLTTANDNGQTNFPFTSGKNKYDFIYISDIANLIVLSSIQDSIDGIINVCTGRAIALGDQVEQFIKDNHLNIKLDYGAFPDRPYDSPEIWGNTDKITKILENY